MSCTLITTGVAKDCNPNTGGLHRIWITDAENVLSLTESAGEVTAISMSSATYFYEYIVNKNTSTFAEKGTFSIENGTSFHEQTVTIKLARRQKSTRNALAMLVRKDLVVIVLDQNGLYWIIGASNGANLTEMPSESGTQKGDFNGYTLTILAQEPVQAYEVTSGAVAAVIV